MSFSLFLPQNDIVLRLIYYLGIYIYWFAACIISPFSKKASLFVSGRKGLMRRIRDEYAGGDRTIWFHCASVGEFEQARPLIEMFRKKSPEHRILLTFFSPSGYELRKNYPFADKVYYLPMDTLGKAEAFIEAVKPEKAIFIKYEFWYNYLRTLSRKGVDTYIVSAIFRPDQHFFKWYGSFFRKMLYLYKRLFVQDEASAVLLRNIGVTSVTVCGDTRFDRVHEITSSPADLPVVSDFKGDSVCMVAGSTWPPDEEIICASAGRLCAENEKEIPFKLVIAPHEVEKSNVERLVRLSVSAGMRTVKYSDFADAVGNADAERELSEAHVLVIDNVGMLSSIYRYADFAYIGGGFGVGIHNILEAATYSIPVVFGPNYRKFREACSMIGNGSAFSVGDARSFDEIFLKLYKDPSFRLDCGKTAADYVNSNLGATEVIFDAIR